MRNMQSSIHELRNQLNIIILGVSICRCDLVKEAARKAAVILQKLEHKNKAETVEGLRVEMN
jgi:hypothetical protein